MRTRIPAATTRPAVRPRRSLGVRVRVTRPHSTPRSRLLLDRAHHDVVGRAGAIETRAPGEHDALPGLGQAAYADRLDRPPPQVVGRGRALDHDGHHRPLE